MLTTYGMGVGGITAGGYGVNSQNNIVELIGIGALISETMKISSRTVSFSALGLLTAQASIIQEHDNSFDIWWTNWRRRRRRRRIEKAKNTKKR